ncbi:MAG: phosphatase PAP2 family protein [Leptospirales bacterium]
MNKMKLMNLFLTITLTGTLVLSPVTEIFGQEKEEEKQTQTFQQVKPVDFIPVGSALFITFGLELSKDQIGPHNPRWTSISGLDRNVRNSLKWPDPSLHTAATISDILWISLSASFIWAPLFDKSYYWNGALVISEAVIYTTFLTTITKLIVGRQRPYSAFGTLPADGVNDNLSFFSGHTSISFAAATSTSLYLSNLFPQNAWWITTLLHLGAGTVAYMRMAGDEHYITDIAVGAATGSLIGWAVYKLRRPWIHVAFDVNGGVRVIADRRF